MAVSPPDPSGERKQRSFAASCVVNRHLQTTAGGNIANALPAVPPVGFPLLPDDWKCRLHFLWFQTCPEESRETCPNLLLEGSCCRFRLSSGNRAERTKTEKGLRRAKRLILPSSVFLWQRKAVLPIPPPTPP